jgi:hypothetical protein
MCSLAYRRSLLERVIPPRWLSPPRICQHCLEKPTVSIYCLKPVELLLPPNALSGREDSAVHLCGIAITHMIIIRHAPSLCLALHIMGIATITLTIVTTIIRVYSSL